MWALKLRYILISRWEIPSTETNQICSFHYHTAFPIIPFTTHHKIHLWAATKAVWIIIFAEEEQKRVAKKAVGGYCIGCSGRRFVDSNIIISHAGRYYLICRIWKWCHPAMVPLCVMLCIIIIFLINRCQFTISWFSEMWKILPKRSIPTKS